MQAAAFGFGCRSGSIAFAMKAVGCNCPHCGAPIDVRTDAKVALCVYCRGTCQIVVDPSQPEAPAMAEKKDVAKETADEVIRLIIDAKRDEAVGLYASAAGVDRADAEKAVGLLVNSLVVKLARHLPISWGAVPVHLAIYAAMAAGAVGAGQRAVQGTVALGLLAVVLAVLAVFGLGSLWRHVRSRIVLDWGDRGVAEVLRTSTIRREYKRGGTLIVAQWEVRPDDGTAAFRDDETMLVANETLPKLEPGNVVRVRFDRNRTLVFPVSPVTVVGHR
jgi:hypothetical protein